MKRVIITGGPGTGKSTLIRTLKARNYAVCEEMSRKIIRTQQKLGTKLNPWQDVYGFSHLVFAGMKKELRLTPSTSFVFHDRGVPDIAAYLLKSEYLLPRTLQDFPYPYVYHIKAFILPPWRTIYHKDNERRESFQGAKQFFGSLKAVYKKWQFVLIEVPKTSPQQRADFVLNHLRYG